MNDDQPAAPSRILLTAKSEYSAAADQLLEGVGRELRIFDRPSLNSRWIRRRASPLCAASCCAAP